MLDQVVAEIRETGNRTGCYTLSERVLGALTAVPRHCFVLADQQAWAYADQPLPIGRGQTISQPFIVALMTELLDIEPDSVVLEIGTGSGYQTAVLARLARQVYSIERIPELAIAAAHRLNQFGFTHVEICADDGARGWEEHAPFDRIMVTAAADEVPAALMRQLKPGGRLIIPVGAPYQTQDLRLLHKDEKGVVQSCSVLPVVFVPLIRDRD
ncbi:MAG: protein-L-isoaspartate(D-aspartate) O-methyltransferase [Candidatus Competibacteraceae bacterium]|nr:protein-L-isoaspartate(D-aspartate) O-methyltransferase [Candidatus Competibacteraceae bacterium]